MKLARFGFTRIQASYTHLMGSLLPDQPHKKNGTRQYKVRVIVYLNFGFERLAMEHVWSTRSGTELSGEENRSMS